MVYCVETVEVFIVPILYEFAFFTKIFFVLHYISTITYPKIKQIGYPSSKKTGLLKPGYPKIRNPKLLYTKHGTWISKPEH